MRHSFKKSAGHTNCPWPLKPAKLSVGAAVFVALYGSSAPAIADPEQASVDSLQEIIVTATRRQAALESVPYSISVFSAEQVAATGVTDIASLSTQVPGLSMYDYGARAAAATTPIIRGINATGSPARNFRSFEQEPVGTYIGNSPIEGYFQFDDVKQVEVLRGPQGTLYGAGALGGALRIIPNSPELNKFSGTVEASGDTLAHSSGTGYTVSGMVNIPMGDSVAFRASAKYAYEPGFINVYGLLARTNNGLSGVPLLANPNDPVNSSPIYSSRSDWNFQKTFTGRASLLWKPNEKFSAEVAILHTNVHGDGGPLVNLDYPGGVSPIDPLTTLPAGGHYQEFSQIDQPFSRYTNLLSLDLSYDAGFATLSSTTSYQTTSGSTLQDSTYGLAGYAGGAYLPYYAGTPTNPRFIYDYQFTDSSHSFSEELRLVSATSPGKMFDYVAGLFYETQTRNGAWYIADPGATARTEAQGCLPACTILLGPNELVFQQIDKQEFQDKSVFGELTWHFMPHGQATFGVRHFNQEFTDSQLYQVWTFPTYIPPTPHDSPASKTVWKVNPSYEYATHQFVYALWSEGFRRGGANSVPQSGIFAESPLLTTYKPDETDNYEVGLKGRFDNGVSYTLAAFDIKWKDPQISSSLPSGNLAVYNANTAESKGFEIETSGPLFIHGLSYSVGYAYVDAKLTSDFSLPANNGLGVIVPGLLSGTSGQQMPGSPKNSASGSVIYDFNVTPGYEAALTLNGVYRSAVALSVAPTLGSTTVLHSSSYEIMNLSAVLKHKAWRATLFVENLLNKQEILAPPVQLNQLGNLTNDYAVNQPRTIGIRVGYSF